MSMNNAYAKLGVALAISLVLMFLLSMSMVRTIDHFQLNLSNFRYLSVRVFLLGATVDLARADGPGRASAHGAAIARLVSGGVELAVSEAEMATRGLRLEDLILGAQPASGSTLAAWTLEADRVLVF